MAMLDRRDFLAGLGVLSLAPKFLNARPTTVYPVSMKTLTYSSPGGRIYCSTSTCQRGCPGAPRSLCFFMAVVGPAARAPRVRTSSGSSRKTVSL